VTGANQGDKSVPRQFIDNLTNYRLAQTSMKARTWTKVVGKSKNDIYKTQKQQIAPNIQTIPKTGIRERRIIVEGYTGGDSIETRDNINKAMRKSIVCTISKSIKSTSTVIITIEKSNANELLECKDR